MTLFIFSLLSLFAGIAIGFLVRWIYAKSKLTSAEQNAQRISEEAVTKAENEAREILLETRDKLLKEQQQQEREARERRFELQKSERRLLQKEENLDHRQQELERIKQQLGEREEAIGLKERETEEASQKLTSELERVASMTRDEAKNLIIEQMRREAEHDGQVYVNKIEQEAQVQADKVARDIIVTSIQRLATEVSGETTTASVSLPSDEMKGRIIGREGRNIRTLETLTGVDIIIDDTPEAVVISCFDPVRKEIARVALERLVQDGRIHPARIEEMVNKVSKEVGRIIVDEGEKVVFDLGFHNLGPELIRALGRLHFRTSYGQNVLLHSKEVAILAGMIIFPATFSFGINPTQGPELIFITLPNVLQKFAHPHLWSILFFLLVAVAALTSTISLCEVVVAYIHEEFKTTRNKAALILMLMVAVLSILCSLSFGVLKDATIFGRTIFDFSDFVSANILLPTSGFLLAIFVGWKIRGKYVYTELITNNRLPRPLFYSIMFCIRYLAPISIIFIFLSSMGLFKTV